MVTSVGTLPSSSSALACSTTASGGSTDESGTGSGPKLVNTSTSLSDVRTQKASTWSEVSTQLSDALPRPSSRRSRSA
jgi:hypothetical protein